MTDWKERAERWNEILPQLEGEMFMYYETRLIEHLEEQLKVARDQAFNAGIEAAARECVEIASTIHSPNDCYGTARNTLAFCARNIRTLSKPLSGSPERLEGAK
jgi:hypothetical protein